MDDGTDVEDQNLVDDQVTEAIGGTTPAPGETVKPTVAPVATNTTSTDDTPVVDTAAEDKEEKPAAFTAEAAPMNSEAISAPAAKEKVVPEPVAEPEPEVEPATPSVAPLGTGSGDDDELMDVKQKALEQLSPLVSHLDLPPDQKFDTYMEIIRASDDKSLIQPAFDAAQQIEDEDKKAQALLDVVNEVNYLTQDETEEE